MIQPQPAWLWAFAFALLAQNPNPGEIDRRHFQFQRGLTLASGTSPQACAVLDAPVFSHAAPLLTDLRLQPESAAGDELPYALTVSEPATVADEPATVSNLGRQGDRIVFDLTMPARPYTAVDLHIDAVNFIATAAVFGLHPGQPQTALGDFTTFDLSAQHLGRNTALALQEGTFPRLHIAVHFDPAPSATKIVNPAVVTGASVPPSREAQTLFTPAAETSSIEQQGKESVARFQLPVRVPVERIAFLLDSHSSINFSRQVVVTAKTSGAPDDTSDRVTGEISRVHLTEAGRDIEHAQLTMPAVLGVNMQAPATLEVRVQNGDDRPLPLTAVRLEMRQRKLCFDTPAGPIRLVYGDPARPAPVYDFGRLFVPSSTPRVAILGPEQINPNYIPRGETRTLTERHPELLWLVLLGVIGVLAFIAFRTARLYGV